MKTFKRIILGLTLAVLTLTASAGSMTNTYENLIADALFRGQALSSTVPANLYVALYTTACTDAARGTEVSGGSYARIAVPRSLAAWLGTHGTATGASSGTTGTVANAAIVQFAAPTGNWGSVTAFGIEDALTGGNQVVCGNLTVPKTVNNQDSAPSFAIGALTVQIDS
ncbi:MAG: hypothetical protein WC856_02550 [Methylococcaceae bacterium]|jgi:hypothetical protein